MRAFLSVSLLLGGASVALASFDLLLAGTTTAIHRYDGDTGVYLGQIATHNQNWHLAVNKATNEVASISSPFNNGTYVVARYDYNTGAFRGSFSVSGLTAVYSIGYDNSGNVMISGAAASGGYGTFRYTLSGAVFGATLRVNGTDYSQRSAHQLSNGNYYINSAAVTQSVTNRINVFNTNGTLVANTILGGNVAIDGILNESSSASGDQIVVGEWAGSSNVFRTKLLRNQGGNGLSLVNTNSFNLANYSPGKVLLAHNGAGYVFGRRNGVSRTFFRANFSSPQAEMNSYFEAPQLDSDFAGGVAVVVAPEPGTMLALGAGVAVLLRRRRRPNA